MAEFVSNYFSKFFGKREALNLKVGAVTIGRMTTLTFTPAPASLKKIQISQTDFEELCFLRAVYAFDQAKMQGELREADSPQELLKKLEADDA
jgi:hypothetical protein